MTPRRRATLAPFAATLAFSDHSIRLAVDDVLSAELAHGDLEERPAMRTVLGRFVAVPEVPGTVLRCRPQPPGTRALDRFAR